MSKNKNIQRSLAVFLLLTMTVQIFEIPLANAATFFQNPSTGSNTTPIAQAADNPQPQNHWGIIAILIEDAIMQDQKSYEGLTTSYPDKLKTNNLADRLRRYSLDAQSSQEFTKSVIIRIPPGTKVENIANALEKLYFQGDDTRDEINKLTGIVIVGNVPLPVVNKKGNRFVSMLPYTDFEDKAYLFDQATGDYLQNQKNQSPKAEIWHGIIKPPVQGEESAALLANYFDKNHLFHAGVPEFATFDKKILFADLFNEFRSMNKFQFGNYLDYIAHFADIAYLRFNKHLAEELYGKVEKKLGDSGIQMKKPPGQTCDKTCVIAKNSRNADFDGDGYSNGYELQVGTRWPNFTDHPTDPWDRDSTPIDFLKPGVFPKRTDPDPKKYVSYDDGTVQDYPDPPAEDSGVKDGLSLMPDVQSRQMILNFLTQYVQLFEKFSALNNDWTNFTGRYEASYKDAKGINRSDMHTIPGLISIKDTYTIQYLRQINDAVERKIDEYANLLQRPVLMLQRSKIKGNLILSEDSSKHGLEDANFVNFAYNKYLTVFFPFQAESLLINGTPVGDMKSVADCMLYRGSNDGTGKNSVMVKAMRTLNPNTAGNPAENKEYAGCYGNNANHPERCFPTRATKPVFDINGSKEVNPANVPQSATDYRACFDFKETEHYDKFEDQVDDYLDGIDSAENEEQKQKVPYPGNAHQHASKIILFEESGVKVTLADVLRKFGRADNKDNDGDGVIDNAAEGDPKYGIPIEDWQQVGERLLKKNQVYIFDGNPFPGVQQLVLTIEPEAAKDGQTSDIYLPSIVYHKEPTQDAHNKPYTSINSQLKGGGSTPSLPIDYPRYVAFQDISQSYRKIIYPDVFNATSLEEYKKTLAKKELEIQGLAAASGIPASPNFLTNIISGKNNVYDPIQKNILKANHEELADTLLWKDLNIDQKHQYVLEKYVGQDGEPFVEKSKNGYEAMYLSSKGQYDQLEMQLNGDDIGEEKDQEYNDALDPEKQSPPPSNEENEDTQNNVENSAQSDGIIITSWFGAMMQWLNETTSKVSTTVASQPFCGTDYSLAGGGPNDEKIPEADTKNQEYKDKKITSNAWNGTSNERKIRIVTYKTDISTNYKKSASGFLIQDESNKTIAEIHGGTGNITLRDDRYQLLALPSIKNKPVRLAVQQKTNGKIIASIFFIANIKKEVVRDESSADYTKQERALEGVHIKDIIPNDSFIVVSAKDTISNPGGADIFEKNSQGEKKIAILDTAGNIFLDGAYHLQPKSPGSTADPVVFYIVNKNNEALFEIYIGITAQKTQILELKGNYENYHLLDERKSLDFIATEKKSSAVILSDAGIVSPQQNPAKSQVTSATDGALNLSKSDQILIKAGVLQKEIPIFKDLKSDHESYADIMFLASRKTVEGYQDGTFKPDQLLTREEFMKLDFGAICITCTNFKENIKKNIETIYQQNPFPDQNISPSLLYCVEEGKNRHIISGYQGGSQKGYFIPKASISRAEATKIILETARQQNKTLQLINESLENKPWFYNYVLTAQQAKLYPKNRFKELDNLSPENFKTWFNLELTNPQSTLIQWLNAGVTRAEFSMMVTRIIEKSDCYKEDKDGDEIPDNTEKYTLGTDTSKADTDAGGVRDGDEILRGTDPLSSTDDKSSEIKQLPPAAKDPNQDTDADGMPDSYEIQYGLNPKDASDATLDKDDDGLTNFQEYLFGTDPGNPDTDGGGTNDGDEILRALDPLDKRDDRASIQNAEGIFGIGKNIKENFVYETVELATQNSASREYISEIPADGQSKVFVRAEVLDENGDIDETINNKIIEFYAIKNSDQYATIELANVKTMAGVAESIIRSTKIAGEYSIAARLKPDDNIPFDGKTLFITPLAPAKIEIQPESTIIKSGGLSNTIVHVFLKDINGNLMNDGSYQMTFLADGKGELDTTKDEDPGKPGIQITSISGLYDIVVTSQKDPGTITIKASWTSPVDVSAGDTSDTQQISEQISTTPPLTAQTKVISRDDLHITLEAESATLPTDGKTVTKIEAKVVDKNNKIISEFAGQAQFDLLQNAFGALITSSDQKVVEGKSAIAFQASRLAGGATITVTVNGFDPASIQLKTLPKSPKKIVLESGRDTVTDDPSASVKITAKLYDADNNFVGIDNETVIKFRLTEATKKFGQLDATSEIKSEYGIATINLRGTGITGPIHLVASSDGLPPAALELKSVATFPSDIIQKIAPNTLFASILGADYGNVTKEKYLGGAFIFSGKSESAIALISNPKPNARLAQIDRNGKITLMAGSELKTKFIPSNSTVSPNRIIFSDPVSKKDIAEVFMVAKPQSKALLLPDIPITSALPEAIHIQNLTTDTDYILKQNETGISVVKQGNETVRISNNGDIKIFDNAFTVALDNTQKNNFLSLKITDQGIDVARVTFVNNFSNDVKKLPDNFTFDAKVSLESGIYLRSLSKEKNIQFEASFSGNSSLAPKGFFIIDTTQDIEKNQAPGQNYLSLESSPDTNGIGFIGSNKHMLLFAAGNSVGESNLPYSSEIGVVLGDPTVRLNNKIDISKTGYTKDIGQEIYYGDEPVRELFPIDYNSDGLKDIFVVYEDGKVRLLQNKQAYPRFTDRGVLLNFANGIISMDSADFNKDGQADLIIATKDSCRKGEVCIDEYENHNGNFIRKNLPLKPFTEKNRVYAIRSADMNNDSFPDIVTSDDSGSIRVFYNTNGSIDPEGQWIGSLGLHIDQKANLKQEVFISYEGMPKDDPLKTNDDLSFKEFPVIQATSALPADEQAGLEALKAFYTSSTSVEVPTPQSQTQKTFIYLDADPSMITSEKRAKDATEPLDTLMQGDRIQYTIILNNSSDKDLNHFMLTDIFPENFSVDKESIVCGDCGKEKMKLMETGMNTRPYILNGFSIPKKSTRTIQYSATVKTTPKVKITLGQNLSKDYAPQDNFMDIGAAPDGNSSGRMTYYHSLSQDQNNKRMNYGTYVSSPEETKPAPPKYPPDISNPSNESLKVTDEDGLPLALKDFTEKQNKDSNGDGLPDAWDNFNNGLDSAADAIQGITSAFTCSGGCIPTPINFAFLAPGLINAMGVTGGFDPGLPVFGWGVPSLVPVWPPSPYQGALGGRIYISPTATMGLGTGICFGPYLTGTCFAFSIPPSMTGIGALCEKIAGDINKAIAGANNFVQGINNTSVLSSSGVPTGATSTGRSETGGMSGSSTLGSYQYKASASTNFQVPGFPAVITTWFSNQTSEIVNKLTDLPDFYFIYPDPTSLLGSVVPQDGAQQNGDSPQQKPLSLPSFSKPFKDDKGNVQLSLASPNKILSFINSIPLIQIQAQEIPFKIPALTPKEIEKLQADMRQWLIDEQAEVDRVKALWKCGGETPYKTACDKLIVDTNALRKSVERNLETLEKYKQLPHMILAWKNITGKYLYQVICYMDAIIQLMGGYMQKQQTRIDGWIGMIRKVKELISTWKAMLDLMVEYQASCDKCSTARLTLMELLLKLFAIIPSPPVIPFPKWPDIYLDLSQVQTGLKITWPDVKFIPERLIVLKIPRITLPDVPDINLNFNLPTIPILPDIPPLPELPDLPPMPLPQLPDIPPPPKIPSLPASLKATIKVLDKILKIICLIKKGFVSVSELNLKSHIEQETERPLNPVLPIDLGVQLQLPKIPLTSVDHIEVKGMLNLQLDVHAVYSFVNNMANNWNSITTGVIKATNKKTSEAGQAAGAVTNSLENAGKTAVPSGTINVGNSSTALPAMLADSNSIIDALSYEDIDNMSSAQARELLQQLKDKDAILGAALKELDEVTKDLARDARLYAEENKKNGKDIYLKATQKFLKNDDPVLNRSLDQVKKDMAFQNNTNAPAHLLSMRTALIAYAENQNNLQQQIGNLNDLEQIGTLLASASTLQSYLPKDIESNGKMTASLEPVSGDTKADSTMNAMEISDSATSLQSFGEDMKEHTQKQLNLLADANLPPVPKTPGMDAVPQAIPKGIYIYNPVEEINENLINNTAESDQSANLNFIDMDNDGDQEVLYNYGGDIYLKENYKSSPVRTYYGGDPEVKELENFIPAASSINGLNASLNANKTVQLIWSQAEETIAGYEITYDVMPDAYEQKSNIIAHKVAIIPVPGEMPEDYPIPQVQVTRSKGSLYQNGTELKGNTLALEQQTQTGENAEILLDYTIQKSRIKLGSNIKFIPPEMKNTFLTAQNVQGNVTFTGSERIFVTAQKNAGVKPEEMLHAIQPTVMTMFVKGSPVAEITMPVDTEFTISKKITEAVNIQVSSGMIEIIRPEKIVPNQKLMNGMALNFDDQLTATKDGSATVNLSNGAYFRLNSNQDLSIKTLETPESPTFQMNLPNGFYYTQIRSVDTKGFLSTPSSISVMSPSLCADKNEPYANVGETERTVSILKILKLDASKSFDAEGEIGYFYLDTDLNVDSDGNGNPTDDKNMGRDKNITVDADGDGVPNNELNDPIFLLGPYQDLEDREVMLNVLDQSLNRSQQKIIIHVTVPALQLNPETATTGKIYGNSTPPEANIPVSIIRDREGVKTPVVTKTANTKGKYFTDKDGKFEISDLNLKDAVVIKNENGEIVAEVDPKTGRIILKDKRYHIEVLAAEIPLLPTRLVVKKNSDNSTLATFFLVSDANTDTTIDPPTTLYNTTTVASFTGVHNKDNNTFDEFEFRKIPADDINDPGATEILDTTQSTPGKVRSDKKRVALLDTGGNFYIEDNRLSLRLKEATNLSEPLIIEILFTPSVGTSSVIGEFNISVPDSKGLETLAKEKFKALIEGGGKKKLPYQDVKVDHPYYQDVLDLYNRHILDNIPTGKTTKLGINDAITRAEFSDIMLKIFCIVPRREAYEEPTVFTDITFSSKLPWYYAVTKEAYFQGFITGYKGEIVPEIGKTPFKPDATITRAEAVKVILEALQRRGVIDMGKIPLTEPYYLPYLQIAQDITPYLKEKSAVKKPFIITAEEAAKPDTAISRGAFIAMADRVLTTYDCSMIDGDSDGAPDFWERKNGLNPFDPKDGTQDTDQDGLTNTQENKIDTDPNNPDTDGDGLTDGSEINKYKTDPLNPDTDGGGISDGIEVKRGTDPLNRHDDYIDPRKDLAEGIYLIQDPCLSCPCPATISHTADIIPGDKIFAIISNDDNSQIFSKSNEITVESIAETEE